MVAEVTAKSGVPHLVVNSAGVARPGYFDELTIDDFRWMMEINYCTVDAIRAAVPGMIARRFRAHRRYLVRGGLHGLFGYSAYGASKFAVAGLSEALRAEMKPLGIGVSLSFRPMWTRPSSRTNQSSGRPKPAR